MTASDCSLLWAGASRILPRCANTWVGAFVIFQAHRRPVQSPEFLDTDARRQLS